MSWFAISSGKVPPRSSSAEPTDIAPRHKPPTDIWAEENPAFGIDHDRPDIAVIRFRGGVARWLFGIQWHPAQKDVWIEDGELLERTLPYRSCRELARRIASVLHAVVSIVPAELDEEVDKVVARPKGT